MSTPQGDASEGTAHDLGEGTDVGAAGLDVEDGAGGDVPATSDPDQFTDDSTLGGTHGENAGGAG
ncbi:MAG TPA: hypothetical protein VM433_14905 [Mycobacteriales bacterium]|nr:hypothetical protein [Mycobacteriales bacterium]